MKLARRVSAAPHCVVTLRGVRSAWASDAPRRVERSGPSAALSGSRQLHLGQLPLPRKAPPTTERARVYRQGTERCAGLRIRRQGFFWSGGGWQPSRLLRERPRGQLRSHSGSARARTGAARQRGRRLMLSTAASTPAATERAAPRHRSVRSTDRLLTARPMSQQLPRLMPFCRIRET